MLVISFSYDPSLILGFAILQATLELYEIVASFNEPRDLLDYFFDYWNWFDATRIVSSILYFHYDHLYHANKENMTNFYRRAVSFSVMTLMAWLGILQYGRFFKFFSGFLTLVIETIKDMVIPLTMFAYLSVMFTQSFYTFDYMTGQLTRD